MKRRTTRRSPQGTYTQSIAKERAAWRQRMVLKYGHRLVCMGCADPSCAGGMPLAQHEIERRSQAPRRWADDCNYLLLGMRCHAGAFDYMPHAQQLAHKLVCDPEHYDLQRWLTLRGLKSPTRVTQEEVDAFLPAVRRLLAGAYGHKRNYGE